MLPGAHVVFALMGRGRGRFQAKPDWPTKSLEQVEQEVDDGWILLVPPVALENLSSVIQWADCVPDFLFYSTNHNLRSLSLPLHHFE